MTQWMSIAESCSSATDLEKSKEYAGECCIRDPLPSIANGVPKAKLINICDMQL